MTNYVGLNTELKSIKTRFMEGILGEKKFEKFNFRIFCATPLR